MSAVPRAWALIAARETLDHLRSVRFVALCLMSLALLPLGAYVNARGYQTRMAYHEALRAAARQHIADAPANGPRIGAGGWIDEGYGDPALRALRAPVPLSALAVGHDASMPAFWQFGPNGIMEGPPLAQYEGLAGLLGEVDFLFVVQVVLGLLAVLLAFDAITGEKESGTLRAVLAHPVPRRGVVAGKFVGGLAALFVPLLVGVPAALAVVVAMGVPLAGRWGQAALLLLAAALYLAGLLALGLAVSASTLRQRTSLVLLLVVWVTLVFVVPRAGQLVAAGFRPVEAQELVRQRKTERVAALSRQRMDRLSDLYRRVMGVAGDTGGITTGLPEPQARLYDRDRAAIETETFRRRREGIRALDRARERDLASQRRLAAALSRLSPAASFGFLATEAAGTGEAARGRWYAQVDAHQRLLERVAFDVSYGREVYLVDSKGLLRASGISFAAGVGAKPPRYADLPAFRYAPVPVREVVRRAALDLALLVAFLVGALLLAAWRFERYDVR